MNTDQRKANETYFLKLIKAKTMFYMWKDKGECYSMSSGKMKCSTLKGYVELSAIVRKDFMKIFVEAPDGIDVEKVWKILDSI